MYVCMCSMYIHIYTCVYIYIYTCLISRCSCVYLYTHVCRYVLTCACIHRYDPLRALLPGDYLPNAAFQFNSEGLCLRDH